MFIFQIELLAIDFMKVPFSMANSLLVSVGMNCAAMGAVQAAA